MLNYGYAVLYSKVQSALISTRLYLNISFYHVSAKFSLSFDLIEEFRVIVDQIVVALISKNADLAIKNGLLDEKTKKLLSQKISLAFLSNYHYKCEKQSLENIIAHQAVLLRRQILNEAKYKGFLVRF